jgi:pectinesterase
MKLLLITGLFLLKVSGAFSQVKSIVVAQDGTGNFTTVQAAINAVADSNKSVTNIYIKKGVYKEKLTLPEAKMNVHFIGEMWLIRY